MPAAVDVLIIDDQPELVLLLNRLFDYDRGLFTTRTIADDFEAGLDAALRERVPDVVVLDMWLTPDGIESRYPLTRKLFHRIREVAPETKIVLYSAVLRLANGLLLEIVADATISKTEPLELVKYVSEVGHRA